MRKKTGKLLAALVSLAAFAAAAGIIAPSASAHTTETNAGTSVLLHVDPDDDPIAAQPANIILIYQNGTSTLDLSTCQCAASVEQNGQTLLSEDFSSSIDVAIAGGSAEFPFTFPAKGVYEITVEGKPKAGAAFEPFSVTFDQRVDRAAPAPAAIPWWKRFPETRSLNIAIAFIVLALAAFFVYRDARRRKFNK
ncbi:MAG TPA: hypothetical protein VHF05_00010 [Candidatus Paceibacterota bacterium]|jgi:hypothetical protein|nr:hypothetical protein [Candidatus Paceibacterota bacterium]